MSESPLAVAGRSLFDGVESLRAAVGPGADEDTRIAALGVCESVMRRLEHVQVELLAGLDRDGVFAARGYRSPAHGVADLLGWDTGTARRRLRVAGEVCARTALDGRPLPARLAATAGVFAAGQMSLRHVEVIAEALRSRAAGRLDPTMWAGAEQTLAGQAGLYRPSELAGFATDLISALDQDGDPPDDDEPEQVNELHLSMRTGKVKGELDGLTRELLAAALDAMTRPGGEEDRRSLPQRQADALGELCRQALDRGELPACGGEKPHLNVIIPLEELERRARAACLDFGSNLSPTDLRMLACDARVVPIVMGGDGQPLDVAGRGGPRRTGCAVP